MIGGWIAVRRNIHEHPIFAGQPERVYVWLWMISTAAWKDTRMDANGRTITVRRGQILTSYRQMSKATGVGVQVCRTLIERLQTENAVNTDTSTGRMLITICNYDKYQTPPSVAGTGSNTGATQEQHTKEQDNHSDYVGQPKSAAFDPAKIAFDAGVSVLADAGIPSGKARSIVGGWRKHHPDEAIIAAIGAAKREGAVDPVAYITASLQARNTRQQSTRRIEDAWLS
jgi:hypothetical protein